jgi:hypothetical protein
MCIISSIYESRKQKKAAEKAQRQAKAASANARAAAESEKKIAESQQAAQAQTVETGDVSEMSAAKRKKGVASTFLNQALGA